MANHGLYSSSNHCVMRTPGVCHHTAFLPKLQKKKSNTQRCFYHLSCMIVCVVAIVNVSVNPYLRYRPILHQLSREHGRHTLMADSINTRLLRII